jgi:hypothetical protein
MTCLSDQADYGPRLPPAMPTRPRKRDFNELAADVVSSATGLKPPTGVYDALQKRRAEKKAKEEQKNPAAVALGRLGGLKGGRARAEALTAAERRKIASNAAKKRWETLNALKSGQTAGEVAKKFGISLDTVRDVKRRLNERIEEGKTSAKR